MRIAVLFYGQPRFLDITKRLIKEEFEFSGHTTDYFAHFWDKIGFTRWKAESECLCLCLRL